MSIGIFFLCNYFYDRNKIKNLSYGIKANELRKSINIPIIDDYMNAENRGDGYSGNVWSSCNETPNKDEVLHFFKIVIPSEQEGFVLNDETDGFRKRNLDGRIMQLNIYSTIIGDSVSKRNGRLFYLKPETRIIKEFTEMEIDSVVESWSLNNRIKN